jgi:large subunit ribosomal protein L12e
MDRTRLCGTSALALIIKALKELPRGRKKQKNPKHNGNITSDQTVSIALQMRRKSVASELSRTIKDILRLAPSVAAMLMAS